jgi:hypothetical protein
MQEPAAYQENLRDLINKTFFPTSTFDIGPPPEPTTAPGHQRLDTCEEHEEENLQTDTGEQRTEVSY